MKKAIARYFGFPLQDKVKGTEIIKTLSFLKESQYWEEERIRQYQLNKLKLLVDYAKKKVPYYEDLFNKIKLSSKDIHALEDIHKIPLLTKQIVREKGNQLVSRDFAKFKVKKGKTGGTTGAPVVVYKDVKNRSFSWASLYRSYEWAGVKYYDKSITLWGASSVLSDSKIISLKNWAQNYIQNNKAYNSFRLSEKEFFKIYISIIKIRPKLLRGYLSSIVSLAEFIENNSIEPVEIKAISTTTETLLPHTRSYLENFFNTTILDQYGCGEVSAIAYECPQHNGLHINREHVIFEVLNENNQSILNLPGKVVATDMDNFVMPFIRYENGDIATLTDIKCYCGVNQPLVKSIEGRSIDTIVLKNGNKVHGVFFTDILYELNILSDKIKRFQVFQRYPGKIEFRIETNRTLDDKVLNKLQNTLNTFFDEVQIIEMKNLPVESNGKFRYILNKINDEKRIN